MVTKLEWVQSLIVVINLLYSLRWICGEWPTGNPTSTRRVQCTGRSNQSTTQPYGAVSGGTSLTSEDCRSNPTNANKDLAKLLVRSTFSTIIIWHDVISNSISPNPSNGSLITSEKLLQIQRKLFEIFGYCVHPERRNCWYLPGPPETGIIVIELRKLTNHRKRKSEEFHAELPETHINENLELQWLRTVLAHAHNPKALTTTRRGKKKPHRY